MQKKAFDKIQHPFTIKNNTLDLQDGGGVRCGDHLPTHKYIKNISTCGTTPAEHLLNAGRRPQMGFPGGAVVENLPANAGDTGSCPGLGRSHMPRSN